MFWWGLLHSQQKKNLNSVSCSMTSMTWCGLSWWGGMCTLGQGVECNNFFANIPQNCIFNLTQLETSDYCNNNPHPCNLNFCISSTGSTPPISSNCLKNIFILFTTHKEEPKSWDFLVSQNYRGNLCGILWKILWNIYWNNIRYRLLGKLEKPVKAGMFRWSPGVKDHLVQSPIKGTTEWKVHPGKIGQFFLVCCL